MILVGLRLFPEKTLKFHLVLITEALKAIN